jgi:hypothetical protein
MMAELLDDPCASVKDIFDEREKRGKAIRFYGTVSAPHS